MVYVGLVFGSQKARKAENRVINSTCYNCELIAPWKTAKLYYRTKALLNVAGEVKPQPCMSSACLRCEAS